MKDSDFIIQRPMLEVRCSFFFFNLLNFPLNGIDGFCHRDLFWAGPGAFKMIDACPDPIRIIQLLQTLHGIVIPGIKNVSKGPNKGGRPQVPVIFSRNRASRGAAGAENTTDSLVESIIFGLALCPFFFRGRGRSNQVRPNQADPIQKRTHVDNQVLKHRERGQGL